MPVQRRVIQVEAVAQQVDLAPLIVAVQLDAGDQLHAQLFGPGKEIAEMAVGAQGVVVAEGDGAQAGFVGGIQHFQWGCVSIRYQRVKVQVGF